MSHPKVTIENYEQVYKYYAGRKPNRLAMAALLGLGQLYDPRIRYAEGAEDRIGELVENGTRLIMTSNHINMFDQLPVAVVMHRGPLRPVINRTLTLAKQPYFTYPGVRKLLDMVGGVPVWRRQDVPKGQEGLSAPANRAMIDTVVGRMAAGAHVFCFAEGTRNRNDPNRLLPIKNGLAAIAVRCAVQEEPVPVAMVHMGLHYGGGLRNSPVPTVYVGGPIEGPFAPDENESEVRRTVAITRNLRQSMQQDLNMAISLSAA